MFSKSLKHICVKTLSAVLATSILAVSLPFLEMQTKAASQDLLIGGPGTGNGQFSAQLRGIDTDASGNLYELDGGTVNSAGTITSGLFRVQKFNAAGAYQSQFSVSDPTLLGNNTPTRIAVSENGKVFVLFTMANQVRRYDGSTGALEKTYSYAVKPTDSTNLRQLNGKYYDDILSNNTSGIEFCKLDNVPYLFVMLGDGQTVKRVNLNDDSEATITLKTVKMKYTTDITIRPNGDIVLLGAISGLKVTFNDQTFDAEHILVRYD